MEGDNCDTCKDGTFDLQQMNPDGCTNCFCSGKTLFCESHERLVRTKIETMENYEITSFQVDKTISEQSPRNEDKSLVNYSGELAVSFNAYPDIDLTTNTLYFKLPDEYMRNQITSYGGNLNYQVIEYISI